MRTEDLKDKTLDELEQIVINLGGKKYLAGYIFHFIHAEDASDISQITPLSKAFREQLISEGYYISKLSVIDKLTDKDGTIKYVFDLSDNILARGSLIQNSSFPDGDGHPQAALEAAAQSKQVRIEAVLLFDDERRTLCVSTQAGCVAGCVFCATGKIKFQRNLSAGEIVDQVNTVQADAGRISNVVYMGMGEPLANYDAVVKSVRILNNPSGKNIGIRHLTISTSGIAEVIKKLGDEDIHPRLAVSLNAPTDDLRTRIMPINKKYPIAKLLDAVRVYQLKTKERVTFEYVLIKGLNDSPEQAGRMVRLLRGIKCNVNLIEYNPHPACEFEGSDRVSISHFAEVIEQGGIEVTIRFRKGRDIYAACGQLGATS